MQISWAKKKSIQVTMEKVEGKFQVEVRVEQEVAYSAAFEEWKDALSEADGVINGIDRGEVYLGDPCKSSMEEK